MQKRLLLLFLFFILLLAAGLRFYMLDGQSFWADEGNSVVLAQEPVTTIIRSAAADIHPPAYYFLLKIWGSVFGLSEKGARSLSAVLGVLVVWGVYLVGTALKNQRTGLLAALLAAINPFLIYYSQEARMYQLLVLAAVITTWALLQWWQETSHSGRIMPLGASLIYLVFALLGLYTHYAFPIHLITLNLIFLIWLIWNRGGFGSALRRYFLPWVLLQGAVVLLYLPWLRTALHQLATWPKPAVTINALQALVTSFRLFTCGPILCPLNRVVQAAVALFAAGLILFGIGHQRRTRDLSLSQLLLPLLWGILPVAAMLITGTFTPTFFKFLILALPAYLILLALGMDAVGIPAIRRPRKEDLDIATIRATLLTPVLFLLLAYPSVPALEHYFHDPLAARDDYRSIAAYIKAVSGPNDTVILTAPGQIDAFSQYDHGKAEVIPLPEDRPLDTAKTLAQLNAVLQKSGRIFAIYWATEQADPQGVIENYLAENAFKAWDVWVGHLRFVAYSAASPPELIPYDQPVHFGEAILLEAAGYSAEPLQPGDIARVRLSWLTNAPLTTRYKVTLQLWDPANQIIAQMDSEPGGGAHPTTSWTPGKAILDGAGLPIPLATPPGQYPLILAVYDPASGQRLPVSGQGALDNALVVGSITIRPPQEPPPAAILPIRYPAEAVRPPFVFLGYTRGKQGFGHDPDIPLRPGDILHLTTFWRATSAPPGDYQFEFRLDETPLGRYQLAGPGYPTSQWLPGFPWRGEHAVMLPPELATGRSHRLSLQILDPVGNPVGEPVFLKPKLKY